MNSRAIDGSLTSIYADVATNVVPYWWVAAAVIGLMGVAVHYVSTRDR
jgi:hypothetical protein